MSLGDSKLSGGGNVADELGTSKSNLMKISLQSENTMASAEDDDAELEEVIWNLMGKAGLLTDIKCQVTRFIQSHVNSSTPTELRDRVDSNILASIYEYLQWIGMKQTCSMLLSESPVEFNKDMYNTERENDEKYKPVLFNVFENTKDSDNVKILNNTEKLDGYDLRTSNANKDETNFSSTPLNKTYITKTSEENEATETGKVQSTFSVHKEECNGNKIFNENTFEMKLDSEVPKETGDNLIASGDVMEALENRDKQDYSGFGKPGKSYSDTFEAESLLELVEDLSLDKDKAHGTTTDVNSSENSEDISSGENAPSAEQDQHESEDRTPNSAKENEGKSNNSLHVSQENKVKDMPVSMKSVSNFSEESISELLEDLSLDNTEDATIPSEAKNDVADCDYLIKL